MNPTIRGRVAVWGIETEAGDTWAAGIITGQGHEKAGAEDFLFDGNGFTISQIFFDEQDVCDIDVICEAASAVPDRGDDIQIAGFDCIVQGASTKWEQKGWKKLNIKAKKFANLVE
ncbi:MAG: hypothetical protein WC485_09145 [Opitutaceae bacterium]